jgi:hypothetical protein
MSVVLWLEYRAQSRQLLAIQIQHAMNCWNIFGLSAISIWSNNPAFWRAPVTMSLQNDDGDGKGHQNV